MQIQRSELWIAQLPTICALGRTGSLSLKNLMDQGCLWVTIIPVKLEGIGKIHLKMNDGVVQELEDVRYVPEMKKNLISVGELDSRGFEMTLKGGVLKV